MALHLKQGSSLLDNEDHLSSACDVAEVSDHDMEEDSDEYYEEEDDDNEEITEQVLIEKEDDVDTDIVEASVQNDDALSSSSPQMSMLSTFLKKATQEKTTESSSDDRVSEKTPNVGVSPQASQSVVEEQTSPPPLPPPPPPPTASERKKEGSIFSDDDYEFFSKYLNEEDEINFEHASRDSFEAPAATGEVYEEEVEDVFQPAIGIEEQFLLQEEAIRSANSLPTTPQPPLSHISAVFPQQRYSFTSVLTEVEMPPPLPPQVSPGLITEASVAASKITSQSPKLNQMAFAIKVKMLREETKGLHCNKLVDILFGEDDDNLKMPSLELRKKLKKAIDIELTVKRFMDYKAVVDINTAEIFMKDKNALEDICRQQVMSNPLLSSLDNNDLSIANNKSKTNILENESDSASIVSEKNAVVAATPQVVLYQELTDLLTNFSENTDPATRLTNKISFLKKMLAFKVGNMCDINRMLNLFSFIVKQAINMIGGGPASERVLLQNGGSSFYSDVIEEDPSLSGAGIGLLFGTILGGVNSAIIRSCVSVARLAMTMGVPIVMLNWPQEFKASKDYESILRDSFFKFKNISNISISFILDSVFDGVEEDTPAPAVSILTDKEKAQIIRDFVNNKCNDRDFFGSMFDGYGNNKKRETLDIPMELLYQNASSVIEQKNKITDNMLSGIVDYLEENKHLLSKILNKLISKASLAATMYYINAKNNNVKKTKAKKGRRILAAVRRGVVGDGLSASRGRLRSLMPVIAAPQQITSSRCRSDSDTDYSIPKRGVVGDGLSASRSR